MEKTHQSYTIVLYKTRFLIRALKLARPYCKLQDYKNNIKTMVVGAPSAFRRVFNRTNIIRMKV